mmetsp:Transcript_20350/g.48386  ORF Transcript_20350/g.48386 Transcript_20350/m.48386 type:complete len:128 (+) Transcript_20350:2041-2424(+)
MLFDMYSLHRYLTLHLIVERDTSRTLTQPMQSVLTLHPPPLDIVVVYGQVLFLFRGSSLKYRTASSLVSLIYNIDELLMLSSQMTTHTHKIYDDGRDYFQVQLACYHTFREGSQASHSHILTIIHSP